jgi:transposase
LRLRADELQFIQRLRPLLETPRAVKRFVNLYRLVRPTIADDELDGFIGADGTGPYQAVLVLLAVLVSAPQGCRTLVAALREPNREGSIAALVEELASANQSSQARDVWSRLLDVMRNGDPLHDSLPTYRGWAATIARFSFETWDLTEPR